MKFSRDLALLFNFVCYYDSQRMLMCIVRLRIYMYIYYKNSLLLYLSKQLITFYFLILVSLCVVVFVRFLVYVFVRVLFMFWHVHVRCIIAFLWVSMFFVWCHCGYKSDLFFIYTKRALENTQTHTYLQIDTKFIL